MSNENNNPKDIIRRYNQEILKYYKQQQADNRSPAFPNNTSPASSGSMTPASSGSMTPASSGGMTPASSGGMSPASSGGMTPASSGRMSPSQPMTEINEVQDNSADNISSRYPEPQIPSYMSSSSLLTDMNSSGTPDSGDSRGWLSASLAAADNTIPIGDALVLVSDDNNNLLSILISNDSGKTRSIAVSTPSKAVSETPSSAIPYSSYNMNVFKKGYYEVVMQNISVFPDTESIQLVNMVPLPFANPFDTLVFPQTETGQ